MINKLKSRRKFKWVNSKPKFRLSQGIIMPIILLVVSIAMGIVIYNNINYSHLSTSVRDINSLHESVEDVNVGDIINYDINGNEEWKVLSVDKANNSMQVVSNKNVAEIEIGSDNYQNALEIFQEEADKYYDNRYVVEARTVSKSDLEYFAFTDRFWLSDIN